MAQFTNMPSGFIPVQIIDVTTGVGAGRANSRADVLLVQAALNKLMAAPGGRGQLPDVSKPATAGPLGPVRPSLPALVVDGIFGKKTLAAIKAYQSANIAGASAVVSDGGVDPVHTFLATASSDPIGGATLNVFTKVGRFTMFKLNSDILKLFGKVLQETELPPEVQASLRKRRS
jgi:peptidoglycan hydrolase-like protein with peptidoglycan-binding domain